MLDNDALNVLETENGEPCIQTNFESNSDNTNSDNDESSKDPNFINDTSILRLNETLKSFECIFCSPSNCSTLPTIKQNTAHKHFFYDYNISW